MIKIILGIILVAIAYKTQDYYSAILLVQGMIFINFGAKDISNRRYNG